MSFVRRIAKLAFYGLATLLALAAAGWGLLQTGAGKAWLAAESGRALSDPSQRVTVSGLAGTVPFDLRARAIVFADAEGSFLTIDDAAATLSAKDLLRGRLVFHSLGARSVDFARPSTSPGETDLTGLLHPPLPVAVERLEIGALTLGGKVLGTAMTLAMTGSGDVGRGRADADIALHRIDGAAGEAALHLALDGAPLRLGLDARISEPTGAVLAGLLHRDDALPLTLTLAGDGTLDNWEGRLAAAAGANATATAHVAVTGNAPYRLSLDGTADIAALLPPALRPLAAGTVTLSGAGTLDDAAVAVQKFDLASAGAHVAAQGRYAQADGAIAGTANITLGDLAPVGALAGMALSGAGQADLSLDGTLARPKAQLALGLDRIATAQGRIANAQATIALSADGDPRAAPVAFSGSGTVEGIAPDIGGLGRHVDWRAAGQIDIAQQKISADTIDIRAAGAVLAGSVAASLDGATGEVRLTLADLAPFDGGALAGTGDVTASFAAARDGSAMAVLSGAIMGARSGIAALDRVLGARVAISGTLRRRANGAIEAREVALDGAAANVTGEATRGSDGAITASFVTSLPRLTTLDPRLAGALRATGEIAGRAAALHGTIAIAAPQLTAEGMRIEALEARVALSRLMPLAAHLDGTLRVGGVDAVVTADAAQDGSAYHVTKIAASADGARLEGAAEIVGGRIDGRLGGNVPDLGRFSALAGTKLAGRAQFEARAAGNRYELTLDASGLGGAGGAVQKFHLAGAVTDPLARPSGEIEATLAGLDAAGVSVRTARLAVKSDRPGHFALDGTAEGRLGEELSLAAAGDLAIENGAADLRLAKLTGAVGGVRFALGAPLAASWRGAGVRFAGLVLRIGDGRLDGEGAIDNGEIALRLAAKGLPVHTLARLAGQSAEGTLGFDLSLAGTRAAPQGRLVVDGEGLRFAAAAHPDLPAQGLVMSAEWLGGRVTMQGRLAGPKGAAIGWQGSAPLQLDPQRLAFRLPPDGALAFHLEGEGDLGALADLVPLGEDRMAGHFAADVRVAGTVGDPIASGKLAVTAGRYESLEFGTELTNVELALTGDRERLVLQKFSAGDGGGGTLDATGAVDLAAAAGPSLNITAALKNFRALKRDEGTGTASGTLAVTGPITAPSLKAAITIDGAEIAVPERLPQSLSPVEAVEIDSAAGTVLTPQAKAPAPALVAVALDVTITLPGRVFVRGRGLDSEWRGRLAISGTTRAPVFSGRLDTVRGTFDFIGTTFVVDKGAISFRGGRRLDPDIDIVTKAQANEITAIVGITGSALKPTFKLSSEPNLPRDEILSRLLFGTSMNRISAAQGLQLAGAAASLAGGGSLDVLSRIRKSFGLDRLTVGASSSSVVPTLGVPTLGGQPGQQSQAVAGPATGLGTTPLGPTGNSGTALNAGKYVANGVYVGVSQGFEANSSTVNVEVDVSRHITVTTEAGPASGTGLGINWKLDY